MSEIIKSIRSGVLSFIFGILLTLQAIAFSYDNPSKDKYCAEVKEGKVVMVQEEKILTADVTLNNGTIITTDANLIKKDGVRTMLKAGECVDLEGNIVDPTNGKVKKETRDKEHK